MSIPTNDLAPAEHFHELRRAIDERLIAKGLPPSKFAGNVLETSQITPDDVTELKDHMAKLMALEGRRSFWLGFATNAGFFILGLIASKL